MRMLLVIFGFFLSLNTLSQDNKLDLYDLHLNELSQLKVISASKIVEEIAEIPASIKVINYEEIKEKGYFTLEEVLSDLPGFQFRNIMGMNSYVFQRGIPNQNNLIIVLIDGIQVNELNSGGFYGGGQYNLSNIERIEVVYGPSSVAYGTNAISGIINIITKDFENVKGSIKGLYGGFNTIMTDGSINISNKNLDLKVKLTGMVKRTEKGDLRGEAGDNNWTDLMENFENDVNLGIKLSYKDFVFGSNYLQKQTSTSTLQKTIGTSYKDYGTLWNILFFNSYLKYSKNISKDIFFSSTLYNRNSTVLDNSIYWVNDTAQVGYYRPNNLSGLEVVVNYSGIKNLSLTSGLTYEYEKLANNPSMTYSDSYLIKPKKPEKPMMHSNHLISLFLEPRYVVFKRLFISAGFRYDFSSVYNQILTPRLGLSYSIKQNTFKLLYAEAFRAPKPWDYTDGLGNPYLLPEKMNSLEFSFISTIFKNLTFGTNIYRNVLNNSLFKEVQNDGHKWINRGEIKTIGFELNMEYSIHKIDMSLNYTYNDSKDQNGINIPEISQHCGNASFSYSILDNFRINLRGNFVGERENNYLITSTNSNYIESYFILNGSLLWNPVENFTLQLIGKNILNQVYYHTSNRSPERYRQPQRTIMVSIGYIINSEE